MRSSGTLSGYAFGGFRAPWTALKVPENRTVRPLSLLESMLFPARQRPGAPGRKLLANSAQSFPFGGQRKPLVQADKGKPAPQLLLHQQRRCKLARIGGP